MLLVGTVKMTSDRGLAITSGASSGWKAEVRKLLAKPARAADDGGSCYTRIRDFVRHLRDDRRIPVDVIIHCLDMQVASLKSAA
jgi:hypothetical protein